MAVEVVRIEIPVIVQDQTSAGLNKINSGLMTLARNAEKVGKALQSIVSKSSGIERAFERTDKVLGKTHQVEFSAEDHVTPVASDVENSLDRVNGMSATTDIFADDMASMSAAEASDALASLDGEAAEVGLGADDSASEQIGVVSDATAALDGETANVEVYGDDNASDVMVDVQDEVSRTDGGIANVEAYGDDNASDVMADVQDAVSQTDGGVANVEAYGEDNASGVMAGVQDAVAQTDGGVANVEVYGEDNATDVISSVDDALSALDGATATVHIETDNQTGGLGSMGGDSGGFSLSDLTGGIPGLASASTGFAAAKSGLIGAAGFAGLSLGVGSAINSYKDFEYGMSEVKAISGANEEQMQELTALAKQSGATTKFTATESAEALKYMGMAGWDPEEMIAGLPGIVNLAAASGTDIGSASDIVTDALTAFGMAADDSDHFADVLAKTSASANTNVGEMGEAFKYVGAVAGGMNYSIEDTALAIGLMSNASVHGSMAGTSLRRSIQALSNASGPAQELLDKYGVSLYDGEGKAKSLKGVMDNLRESFGGMTDEVEQNAVVGSIFGQQATAGMLAIINATDEDYQKLVDDIASSTGSAEEMSGTMLDNLSGSLTLLGSAFEDVQDTLGEQFAPAIRSIVDSITEELPKASEAITTFFGEMETAFNADGLSGVADKIGDTVADIADKIGENSGAAIDAATEFMSSLFASLSDTENSKKIGTAAASIVTNLGTSFATLAGDFGVAALSLISSFTSALTEQDAGPKIVKAITDSLTNIGNWFSENGGNFGEAAGELLSQLALGIAENSSAIISAGINIITGLATGLIKGLGILIGQAPKIVADLAAGIIDNIPMLFQAGVELINAVKEGAASAAVGFTTFLAGLFTDTSASYQIDAEVDYDNPGSEILAGVQQSMEDANSQYAFMDESARGYFESLATGAKTYSELNAEMQQMEEFSPDFMSAKAALDAYVWQVNTLREAGVGVEESAGETAEALEETAESVDKSATLVEDAMERVVGSTGEEAGTSLDSTVEDLEKLAESYAEVGDAAEEAMDVDLADSLGGMTGDVVSSLISSEDMSAKASEINEAMGIVAQGLSETASQMNSTVSESMSTMTESLTTGQEAFTTLQETAETALSQISTGVATMVSEIQEAMNSVSMGSTVEAPDTGAAADGAASEPSGSAKVINIMMQPGTIDTSAVTDGIQSALDGMGPFNAAGQAVVALSQTNNSAEVRDSVEGDLQSQFASDIVIDAHAVVNVSWDIQNGTQSLAGSAAGAAVSVNFAANGAYLDSPHLMLAGEDGPEYIVPVGSKHRERGIELWEEAGKALGMPAYAEGGLVGGTPVYDRDLEGRNVPATISDTPVPTGDFSGSGSSDNRQINVYNTFSPTVTVNNAQDLDIDALTDEMAESMSQKLDDIFSNMPYSA